MPLYADAVDLRLAKPIPAHALTPAALAAVDAVRQAGHTKRLDAVVTSLATEHGHERIEPYSGGVPASAKRVLAAAEAKGMRAHVLVTVAGCVVEAIDVTRGVAFRASWERGSTKGGSWHEAEDRYTLIDDPRAVGVNAKTKTGLARKRPAGMDRVHRVMIAARAGIPCNLTEIERRLDEL